MATTISLNGSDWTFKGYIGEDWLWRGAVQADTRDIRGWQVASVPGSVQNDLWKAGLIPDPYFEMNSLAIEWVPERTWLYKKRFTVPAELEGQRIQLVFAGVDYAARYFLNGKQVGQSAGTYLPAAFDVAENLLYGEENLLTVVIDPAPFEQPQIGYTSKVYTQKARMNYWWDFCPRMVHLGIWQDVYLRATGPAQIENVFARPVLSDDLRQAEISVEVEIDLAAGTRPDALEVDVVLRAEGSQSELGRARLSAGSQNTWQASLIIDSPELWWPNGAGAQPLYEVEVTARLGNEESDTHAVSFGIRRVEFVRNEGAGEDTLPYNLMVNGQKQYIKGWNWVPADVLYGAVQPERYQHLLVLAQKAHVNMLRVWGGGLIERERFYDLCDRLGILVWQEFIQSSSGIDNFPSEDPQFIQFLVKNAQATVRARRNHPALAVWCGGNELHYAQDRLCDDTHPALAALKETVQRLDPGRHWLATSPAGGVFSYKVPGSDAEAHLLQDVHGPWEFQGLRKQFTLYNGGQSLLHSEFGVEGVTNRRSLDQTIAREQQWPVSLNNPVWDHLGAWWVKEKVWQEAFGPLTDTAAVLRCTQFIQAAGLRYALEADRRRAFRNGGTMPWQFNEPYPMAACTSAVDYYGEPKPVYYSVKNAYRDLSCTARFDSLAWGGESQFSAEAWCSNFGEQQEGMLTARVIELDGRSIAEISWPAVLNQGETRAIGTIQVPMEQIGGPLFFLDLSFEERGGGRSLYHSRYLFSSTENMAPVISLPPAQVSVKTVRQGDVWQLELHNPSGQAALGIWLEAVKEDLRTPGAAYFADNYINLLPGETVNVRVDWWNMADSARSVLITGWNFESVTAA